MDRYCTLGKHETDASNFSGTQGSCRKCHIEYSRKRRERIRESERLYAKARRDAINKGSWNPRTYAEQKPRRPAPEKVVTILPTTSETHKLCGMRWV